MKLTWNWIPRIVLGLCCLLAAFPCRAESPAENAASQRVEMIIHVDVIPQFTDAAVVLLKGYRQDSLKEAGARRVDILQQVGRPNHFTIVEEWVDQRAYDRHVSAAQTVQFRTKLAPMLGSPFDDRPHRAID